MSCKSCHPPLTAIPIGAYAAAAFDVISFIGDRSTWQRVFYKAATFVFIAGALVSLGAVVTGMWDRGRSSGAGTQAWRTINAHVVLMVMMTVLALIDLDPRSLRYHTLAVPTSALLGLSLAAALIGALVATYGGTLVFGYGFNIETVADHPVWRRSEIDVFPGQRHNVPTVPVVGPEAGDDGMPR
ncbi:MAG: DUF2231 domain-containing protein [Acidimicrobiales bacterium]